MSASAKKRKTDPESSTGSSDPGLPPDVMAIASRISLRTNVTVPQITRFLEELIGKQELSHLKYQTYNIRDLSNKMLRYAQKQHHVVRRRKAGILRSKERKRMFDISKANDLRYQTFTGLNHLWSQYMEVVINSIRHPVDEVKLLKADYHGAGMIVAASRNPDLVNITGIVVQETKNMIRMIRPDDSIVSVPKIGSVFAFLVKGVMYKITGCYISVSPPARSRIKVRVIRKDDNV